MVVIDAKGGPRSMEIPWLREIDPQLCIFEFVYFARPDSRLYGREVHERPAPHGGAVGAAGPGRRRPRHGRARVGGARGRGLRAARAGSPTARPWSRTATSAVPSSRRASRSGPTRCGASSTPCARTSSGSASSSSTTPSCAARRSAPSCEMLREAGAAEVHLRISSPPLAWPCFYGIDIPDRDELARGPAHRARDRRHPRTWTLSAYLSLDNLVRAIDAPGAASARPVSPGTTRARPGAVAAGRTERARSASAAA